MFVEIFILVSARCFCNLLFWSLKVRSHYDTVDLCPGQLLAFSDWIS
jgi:hypothetical protein